MSVIADTPKPPYFAVIFTSTRTEGDNGYGKMANRMVEQGIRNFVISHLSQKLLIPENCRIITNENVYVFNNAAVKCIQNEGVDNFIFPFEIDFETLESISNRNGIVPLYFYPELFYSRMPVQLESSEEFAGDDTKTKETATAASDRSINGLDRTRGRVTQTGETRGQLLCGDGNRFRRFDQRTRAAVGPEDRRCRSR